MVSKLATNLGILKLSISVLKVDRSTSVHERTTISWFGVWRFGFRVVGARTGGREHGEVVVGDLLGPRPALKKRRLAASHGHEGGTR